MSDLSLTRATYLGTNGADSAAAIAVSPVDGSYIVAANFNGAARLQRYSASAGTAALSNIALAGSNVRDMDVNRTNGQIAVVGNFGLQVFDSNGTTLLWQKSGSFDRVAIANDGTVVALNATTDTIPVWNGTGNLLATRTLTGGDIRPADVAIDPITRRIFVTGFTQVTPILQTPFVLGLDRVGSVLNTVWDTWNYSAAQVIGTGLAADSRGLRIDIGADGSLYFLGKTDGGNTVFTRDGNAINTQLGTRLIDPDQYTDTSNSSGAKSYAFYAKLNANNGNVERGQILVTRLTNGQANSFTPTAIAADASGNVFIGGSAAFRIANRDTQTINGQPVGSYALGEPSIMSVSSDFQTRHFWTALTRSGDTTGSVGSIAGFAIGAGTTAFISTITSPDVATLATDLNPKTLGGSDVYLAMIGPKVLLPEINVQNGVVNILDGSTTPIDFGTVAVGGALNRTFTVKNTGTGDLSLAGLTLPAGFKLANPLPATVAAGSSLSLVIEVDTAIAGTFAGSFTLMNNDSDENPFNFAIQTKVKGLNNAPLISASLLDQTTTAAQPFQYTIATNTFTDPDNDPLTLIASLTGGKTLPSWLSFNALTRTFSGTPTPANAGILSIDLTASDGFGGKVSDTFILTISPAPTLPLNGTNQSDTLVGTAHSNQILGLGGHDILSGNIGNDEIWGGSGNDRLYGRDGNDQLDGGLGNDQLDGGNGNDTLQGGTGDDVLKGGAGNDRLFGGAGNDNLTGGTGADIFVLAPEVGTDMIHDFRLGEDQIGLTGGLMLSELSIIQRGNETWIRHKTTNQVLARLRGVIAANLITQSTTVFITL